MKRRYRIVRDNFQGFEVQYNVWWWPFWLQADRLGGCGTNTCPSIELAETFALAHSRNCVVKDLGRLP